MKIIFITNNSKLYGANLCTLDLMLDLKYKYGVQVFAIVREKGDLTEQFKKHNIPYYCCEYAFCITQKGEKNLRTYLHYFKKNIIAFFKIKNEIKKIGGVDIIHSATSVLDIGYYLSKYLKIPHIWHIRENVKHYNAEFIWKNDKIRKRYNHADALVAISDYIQNLLKQECDVSSNVVQIYEGLEQDEKVLNNGKKLYQKDETTHFCIVGLVSEGKNQFDVVRACNSLVEKDITKFNLTIVGSGKEELQRIEQYIFKNNLREYVRCIGYCKDVYSILQNMDVGIMASTGEAFGRATVEYMMHYMPVIASNSGANPELVKENKNGFLFEVHNVEEIVKHMEYFINNKQEIERLGNNAYQFAIRNFTKEKNSEKTYELYQNVLKRK